MRRPQLLRIPVNSALMAVAVFAACILAYLFYGRFLSLRVFSIDPARRTPAHELEDGVDFVPVKRHILFAHHFTSISCVGPIRPCYRRYLGQASGSALSGDRLYYNRTLSMTSARSSWPVTKGVPSAM